MPGGELFDRSAHGRLGDGVEFGGQPGFETGQGFIALGEQPVVLEQAAQVRNVSARAGGVQAFVAKRDVTGGQTGQQRLDFGERFQVRMLSGRSTLQKISTTVVIASGSAASLTIRAVRSSRRAQRAHCPRRCSSPSRLAGSAAVVARDTGAGQTDWPVSRFCWRGRAAHRHGRRAGRCRGFASRCRSSCGTARRRASARAVC